MLRKKNPKSQLDFLKYADLAKDSDQDGLFDTEEEMLGTDPNNPDTDNDGMNDFEEIKAGRNPLGPGLLRDLFIPHKGNDYKPKSLEPKRLLFYGGSAVLVKFIALLLVVFVPVTAWLTPDVMKQESQQIISLTNDVRKSLNLNALQTNELLQQAALNKAQDMMINQYFAHVGPDGQRASSWVKSAGYGYKVIGENLALGFSSANEVVNAWKASPTHYANLIDEDFTDIGVAMVSGNYNGYDTTLVAQYFGKPIVKTVPVVEPVVEPVIETPIVPEITTPNNSENTTEIKPTNPEVTKPTISQPNLPVIVINPPIITEPISIEPEHDTVNEVLADRQVFKPALNAPQLISPANEHLTNQNKLTLDILAIQAEKVLIWADNQLVLQQSKDINQDSLTVEITLSEGIHSLQLESVREEQRQLSADYIIIIDNTAPVVDETRTILLVDEPQGKTEKIIQATAYLSSDTQSATVSFGNRQIDLQIDETGKWTGSTILTAEENEEVFNPVVLATLTTSDFAGNQSVSDVGWENIKPMQTSLLNQYMYLKTNSNSNVRSVFGFGDWYYRVLLFIAMIALALNVFIGFRKQNPKTIMSSIGFIGLLLVLLIV